MNNATRHLTMNALIRASMFCLPNTERSDRRTPAPFIHHPCRVLANHVSMPGTIPSDRLIEWTFHGCWPFPNDGSTASATS